MNTPYLLSSALSSTHYAVVQQIENATSAPEVDAVYRRELDRLQHRLEKGKGRVQDADIVESLVLLLYLEQHRSTPVAADAVDFALVPALNLAEGGKTRQSRALGYLYLGLTLRPTNDLSLLHFNSIIKDLQSSHVGAVAQALRAIVHAPSADIAPAVQRQVVHLVSHKSAEVRRLALAALGALAADAPDALEGLRGRKVWKRLKDSSPSVALQAVKMLCNMSQNGLVANDTAADALVELLHAINTQTLKEGSRSDQSLLKVELVKALVRLDPPQDDSRRSASSAAVHDLLQLERSDPPRCQALVLLLTTSRSSLPSETWSLLLPTVSTVVKAALLSAAPNDTYFALRCLEALPLEESGCVLGDCDAMERLTAALQSEDVAVRKMSIRILGRLSPDLPVVHLDRIVQALSVEEEGHETIASRALEVAALIAAREATPRAGDVFAASVVRVAEAAGKGLMLEGLVQQTLDWLHASHEEDQASFAATLLARISAADSISRTLSVVACAVLCEFGAKARLPLDDVARLLTTILQLHDSASIHQAVLVSLAGVCATLGDGLAPADVVSAVQGLRETASRYVRRRCDTFLRVAASADGFSCMRPLLTDLSLPTVLAALEAVAKTLPDPSDSPAHRSSASSPPAARPSASSIGLRYDAYPRASPPGGSGGGGVRPTRRRSRSNERALETALTASQRLEARARADKDVALAAGQLALMAVYDAPSGAVETSSPGAHHAAVPYQDNVDADDRASPFRSSPVEEKAPLVG